MKPPGFCFNRHALCVLVTSFWLVSIYGCSSPLIPEPPNSESDNTRGSSGNSDDVSNWYIKEYETTGEAYLGTSFQVFSGLNKSNARFVAVHGRDGNWIELDGTSGFYVIPESQRHSLLEAIIVCPSTTDKVEAQVIAIPNVHFEGNPSRILEANALQLADPEIILCNPQHGENGLSLQIEGVLNGDFTEATLYYGNKSIVIDPTTGGFSFFADIDSKDLFIIGKNGNGEDKFLVVRNYSRWTADKQLVLDFDQAGSLSRKSYSIPAVNTILSQAEISGTTYLHTEPATFFLFNSNYILEAQFSPSLPSRQTYALLGETANLKNGGSVNPSHSYLALASESSQTSKPDWYVTRITLDDITDPGNSRTLRYISRKAKTLSFTFFPKAYERPSFVPGGVLDVSWYAYHSGQTRTVHNTYTLNLKKGDSVNWRFLWSDAYFPEPNGVHHFAFPDLTHLPNWNAAWAPSTPGDGSVSWEFSSFELDAEMLFDFILGEPDMQFYETKQTGSL